MKPTKIRALTLAFVLVLTLAACNGTLSSSSQAEEVSLSESTQSELSSIQEEKAHTEQSESESQHQPSAPSNENPTNDTSSNSESVMPTGNDYGNLLDTVTEEINQTLTNDDNFGGAFYESHLKKTIGIWTLDENETKSKIESVMNQYESHEIQVEYFTAQYSVKQLNSILDDINNHGNSDFMLNAMLDYSKNRIWVYVDKMSPELEKYITDKSYIDVLVFDRGDIDNPAS